MAAVLPKWRNVSILQMLMLASCCLVRRHGYQSFICVVCDGMWWGRGQATCIVCDKSSVLHDCSVKDKLISRDLTCVHRLEASVISHSQDKGQELSEIAMRLQLFIYLNRVLCCTLPYYTDKTVAGIMVGDNWAVARGNNDHPDAARLGDRLTGRCSVIVV